MANIAMADESSPNGTAPVNTYTNGGEPELTHGGSSVMHLDHDHSIGENVRFLAIYSLD
jgi:hypothetical protein